MADTRKRARGSEPGTGVKPPDNTYSAKALLDSGCLIGDCMSQEIVNKLNANHLIVYTNTTICSGFNNECSRIFLAC